MKWCGKSAPRSRQREWQGKPHREQDQIGAARNPFPDSRPGRSREVRGNTHPRGMAIHRGETCGDRTRLTGHLTHFKARHGRAASAQPGRPRPSLQFNVTRTIALRGGQSFSRLDARLSRRRAWSSASASTIRPLRLNDLFSRSPFALFKPPRSTLASRGIRRRERTELSLLAV